MSDNPEDLTRLPPKSASDAEIWAFLRSGIDKAMGRPGLSVGLSYKEHTAMYTMVYNYCKSSNSSAGDRKGTRASPAAGDAYRQLKIYFGDYVQPLAQELSMLDGNELLQKYLSYWNQYIAGSTAVNRMFTFLNRYWVKLERDQGHKDILPVADLAMERWQHCMFPGSSKGNKTKQNSPMLAKLAQATLSEIDHVQGGESQDDEVIKHIYQALVDLGAIKGTLPKEPSLEDYKVAFENPLACRQRRKRTDVHAEAT